MTESRDSSLGCSEVIEAYRTLLDFQKWTYDTYQRDARLFLTIEVVALGLVASSLSSEGSNSWPTLTMICVGAGLGVFLTVAWASRQRREFYMSKGRLERLKKLEAEMPPSFRYFTTDYLKSREFCEKVFWLPAIGKQLPWLPHVYRHQAFLKSLVLQQAFLVLWLVVFVFVIVKAIGL